MSEPVKKSLQELLLDAKAQPHGGPNQVSIYGPIDTDGTWHWTKYSICHATLLRTVASVCRDHTAYMASLTPQGRLIEANREADEAFFAWLLGPESPYRLVTKEFNPDPKFARDVGVAIGDLDTAPVNVLYGFFVASRFFSERPERSPAWFTYVKQGLHPALAWLATMTIEMEPDVYPGHSVWPMLGVSEEWLLNFANGTPARLDGPYVTTREHSGVDRTWGTLINYDAFGVPTPTCWDTWQASGRHSDQLFASRSYVQRPHGRWSAPGPDDKTVLRYKPRNREAGIEILLAEQGRLFNGR